MSYFAIFTRIFLSVVLGGLIGLERQSKHRPAGFRTHILVCLGSATIMNLSELMFIKYHTLYNMTLDPTRMAAQVISGIGFLGAGTIIHYHSNVKGLTTAASLWAVAAIGLTVGSGFYVLAIAVTAVLYTTLLVFNKISLRINQQGNILEIIITLINKPKTVGAINLLLAKENIKILDMAFINPLTEPKENGKYDEIISMRIVVLLEESLSYMNLMTSIRGLNGVIDVERI